MNKDYKRKKFKSKLFWLKLLTVLYHLIALPLQSVKGFNTRYLSIMTVILSMAIFCHGHRQSHVLFIECHT